MREYKFRGRDGDDWYYGSLFVNSVGQTAICAPKSWWMKPVKAETVGQFTGLLDSNGKEIYEGDIVRFELPPMVLTNEKTAVGEVVYEYGQFLMIIHAMRFTIFSIINDCTIIGNIHDSPELLEEDNARD